MCELDRTTDWLDWMAAIDYAVAERRDTSRALEQHQARHDRELWERRLEGATAFRAWEREDNAALLRERDKVKTTTARPLSEHAAEWRASFPSARVPAGGGKPSFAERHWFLNLLAAPFLKLVAILAALIALSMIFQAPWFVPAAAAALWYVLALVLFLIRDRGFPW